jgi:YHS domain-containing protein
MSDVPEWEQQVRMKLAAAAQRQRVVQDHLHQRMAESARRWQQFAPLADRLVQTILRPRLEKLAALFDNAAFLPPEKAGRYHCACEFRRTERFPATVKLELSVGTDGEADNLMARYDLQILPVLFRFQGQSEIAFPLDAVNEGRLTAWVEERLVAFVDTYLSLEGLEAYQQENLVTDPVCGMVLQKPLAAAHVDYQGRTWYFCVEECRRQFAANPERYVKNANPPAATA